MAKITLHIEADASGVSTALANLKKEAQALSGLKIDLGIDATTASAIAKAASAMASLQRAQAQQAKAQASVQASVQKTIQAHEKTAQAMEKTSQAQEKTAQSANALAAAREKTYQAEEKTSQAMERTAQMQERTAQGSNNLAIQQEKTAQTANRLATEQERTARATQSAGSAAQSASNGFSVLGNAMSVALGHLASRAVSWAFNKVRQGIREALDEMKKVDTELTNISKVSGKTGADLAAIGDTAYETASKYGVAASEYLSAVYDMQKAGMGDQAEAMGELAIKTMLVGDTTQDVASKFLLASNAAWKLNGDMGSLTQIVDEADYINNNYATTLDKLAAGMPIVASVAAQAGMSAEETMAALGTITTVTQESGTKAATALRALILNISKSVGEYVTEEGEAFEVTEESVKNLEGLLWKYAGAEMQAAKDAGKLIDPMTAIQALFKGMSEGDVNDVELFNLLSAMGGKLRTNQLTALVQNYELFDEMLAKIADSAGTADSEIGIMLGSWESKTNILKNTWTQFISDAVETDDIKAGIDLLTDIVSEMDDLVNRIQNPFFNSDKTQKDYDALKADYDTLIAKGDELNSVEQARLKWLERQLELLDAQAKKEEEKAAKNLQDKYTAYDVLSGMSQDESELQRYGLQMDAIQFNGDIAAYQQSVAELNSQWSDYYNNLLRIRDADIQLTDAEQGFITSYEERANLAEADIGYIRQTADGYLALIDTQGQLVGYAYDYQQAQIEAQQREEESLQARAEEMDRFKKSFSDFGELVSERGAEIGEFFTGVFDSLTAFYESYYGAQGDAADGADSLTEAEAGATSEANNTAEAAAEIAPKMDNAAAAVNRIVVNLKAAANAAAGIEIPSVDTQATGTKNAPGGPTLVNELGPELISDKGRAYIANGGRPGIVNLSRGAIVLNAEETKQAFRGGNASHSIHAAASGWGNRPIAGGAVIIGGVNIGSTLSGQNVISNPSTSQPQTGSTSASGSGNSRRRSGNGGGGGGGGSTRKKKKKKSIKTYAEELEDLLSNLDKQAKLADNEGDYAREVEIWEQAQEAINTMVERYRKAGYAEDSDEILDLLNKNYDYANKQVNLYEDVWDELIDALETDAEQQELANKLAEKQLALQEAQEALDNARGQRTVRVYNAETGQWEWVADQKKITSAQKTLDKAQEAYNDEIKSQAIKELEAMKDTITDLNDVVLGPALSAVALMAESSDEFQNFARALNAVYGVGTFLASTEGSDKVLETKDSHDTVYTFGDVVLTEEQASTTTLAELAQMLKVLDTTT